MRVPHPLPPSLSLSEVSAAYRSPLVPCWYHDFPLLPHRPTQSHIEGEEGRKKEGESVLFICSSQITVSLIRSTEMGELNR